MLIFISHFVINGETVFMKKALCATANYRNDISVVNRIHIKIAVSILNEKSVYINQDNGHYINFIWATVATCKRTVVD